MNDQSPPKRVTRARAAAKTTDTGVKTTKIATAASKAKVTRNVSVSKRKTRADDTPEDEINEPEAQIIEPEPPKTTRGRAKKAAPVALETEQEEQIEPEPPKTTRGRARKVVAPTMQAEPQAELEMKEAPAPAKTTRGRPKKAAAEPPAPAPAPTRTVRGRAKTVDVTEEEAIVVEEPEKKPTRSRAGTASKAAAPKKTVKFEEPDKENIVPPLANAKGKDKVVETGLKGKPVRKPAVATTTRATRGRAKVEEKEHKSSPLSPKKATQVATVKDQSEDELATMEKTPMKPLMKSPLKAPGSIFGTTKLDFSTSITVNRVELGGSVMRSPARRPPQSPFKESLKTSPQRAAFGDSMLRSPFKFSLPAQKSAEAAARSPFRGSLMQSPARRPQSPTKVAENGSPSKASSSLFGATPKATPFKVSRFGTPRTITTSAIRPGQMRPHVDDSTGSPEAKGDGQSESMGEPSLKFSGRLSSIMPREADPSLSPSEPIAEEAEDQAMADDDTAGETMVVDTDTVEDIGNSQTTTPPASPSQTKSGAFALREIDENPFHDSDSEDELASGSPRYSPAPLTPTPFTGISKTPRTSASQGFNQKEKIGFTPLSRQLSDWMSASPAKPKHDERSAVIESNTAAGETEASVQPSPVKSTYFDDEMSIRDEMIDDPEAVTEDIHFNPIELDEEDFSLAHEADEMSLLDPESIEQIQNPPSVDVDVEAQADNVDLGFEDLINSHIEETENHVETNELLDFVDTHPNQIDIEEAADAGLDMHNSYPEEVEDREESHEKILEPALSEASQEYGDENAMPLDPALFSLPAPSTPKFSTPKRVLAERVFHTVSKVPLKAAAEESPMRPSPMKRSASISRLPIQRPTSNLSRSNTVISYSPSKRATRSNSPSRDVEMQDVCVTPAKSEAEAWSTIGTPARTPRRDLNRALLKGAVVLVDVHTTEGADASALFTELLTQMGARCIKRWDWNGNSEDGKIGITHIVFKDGGKRTLEKARETGGVVSCVGVGWVLDCERENKWLPESPYSVDTTLIPRGGHRRRKSMEPRALANMNGTLLPSATPTRPARKTMSPTKEAFAIPETPFTSKSHRRDSVQWVRTLSSSSSNDHRIDNQTPILSPIPATPAPETLASAYSEHGLYGDDTPGAQTPYFLHAEQLEQKTAPPGKRYFEVENGDSGSGGWLEEKKDENVMMRLMAARRKSLQFAPKVGSPLAKLAGAREGW